MKKNNKTNSNTAANEATNQFWSIFDHKFNFIEAVNPYINPRTGKLRKRRRGKLKPDWRTETDFPIRPKVLEATYFDPNELIGLSFDSKTNKLALDIDYLSQYAPSINETSFNAILGSLEDIGLCRPVFECSSFNKGTHVWYFLKEKINTFNLACALEEKLKEDSFKIASGQLELFPNAKSYKKDRSKSFYKAIKLPLQPQTGSCLLDNDFNPIDNSIEGFVSRAEWSKAGNDVETLKRACTKYGRVVRLRRCGRSKKSLKKFQQDLLKAISRAFTGKGQTNELLLDIGAYGVIFLRLDEPEQLEELKDWIRNTITSLEGYEQYCGHQHEIEKRCLEVAKSCQEYYWAAGKPRKRDRKTFKDNFGAVLNHVQNGREETKAKATQKIEKAIEHISQEISEGLVAIPRNLTAYSKLIIETSKTLFESGLSRDTLYKPYNKPLWQTAFAALAALQMTASVPVEAAPLTIEPEVVAIAEIAPDALPIAKASSKSTKPVNLEQSAKPAKQTKLFRQEPDPVARAEQSEVNLGKQLDDQPKSKTVQQNMAPSAAEIALNPPPKSEYKTTKNTPPKSPQSQAEIGSTPCKQKLNNQNRQNPHRNREVHHAPLYGGFGGATRLTDSTAALSSSPEPPPSSPSATGKQSYYDDLLARHPNLNALEQQRSDPTYKDKAKQSFAAIRAILARSRRKFKSDRQSHDPSPSNPSTNQANPSNDEAGDGLPSKPT